LLRTDNSKVKKRSLIGILYIHIKPAHDTASLNNINNDPRKGRMPVDKSKREREQLKYADIRFLF
jgi:hypothetical protein